MPTTDITEAGLEALIVAALTGATRGDDPAPTAGPLTRETLDPADAYRTGGYVEGNPEDYDRIHLVDWPKLLAFLQATQPEIVSAFALEQEGPSREQFLARLQGQIASRGIVDILRKGIKHQWAQVTLFYGTPTPGNIEARLKHDQNIFSVTRQLRYSPDELALALDLVLFINGLPVATFELKNTLTKQTVQDAIRQYQEDRSPQEALFQQGRCLAHFAVDEHEVFFCTALAGKRSWFLPFNQGVDQGKGNPLNPGGLQTAYLWDQILERASLTNIIENYAALIEEKDEKNKKRQKQIFPRYHQLDVVRKLLADAARNGPGQRYLIQHSAGSGKSNSIAWLAHQLVELKQDDHPVFDSIIIVTDRIVLDTQLRNTIKQYASVSAVVGAAKDSGDLRKFLEDGKKIIISTVQKFPYVLDEIQTSLRNRSFAIIIDEAHSGQGGSATKSMSTVLGMEVEDEDDQTIQDAINAAIESRKMLENASYFAFTATPKNKTLQLFGTPFMDGGEIRRRPFHIYSMKQAIQEGFILDVLAHYTPYSSYYHLTKAIENDPEFDKKRAQRKLKAFVEGHDEAIRQKAEIIVEHFRDSTQAKIGGKARAMVVCTTIERSIRYWAAISTILRERKSPYQALVAFSGEPEYQGQPVTEASLNGFPGSQIPEKLKEDPYRFLVVCNKFETGYDEPLLHTMYVDKPLSGIKAVQTLSRLNRAMPGKTDTFVLDFFNDVDTIQEAFQTFYQTTILSRDADPNKLHDLKDVLDSADVYTWEQVEALAARFLKGDPREDWQPLLDAAIANYNALPDLETKVQFKHQARTFVRAYNFLGAVLPYGNRDWEQLAIYLTFLTPSLPSPEIVDLADGVLQTIDMDSYRAEKQATVSIVLQGSDTEIDPAQDGVGGVLPEPEIEPLSMIVRAFNEIFGNIDWKDEDRIKRMITDDLPTRVQADAAYRNAIKQGDRQNARIELNRALEAAILALASDDMQLYKHFSDDAGFKQRLTEAIFSATYQR